MFSQTCLIFISELLCPPVRISCQKQIIFNNKSVSILKKSSCSFLPLTLSSQLSLCMKTSFFCGRPHSLAGHQTNDVFHFCFAPSLAAERERGNSHESAVIMVSYGAPFPLCFPPPMAPHERSQGKLQESAAPLCNYLFSRENELRVRVCSVIVSAQKEEHRAEKKGFLL